jgi:hypothetical protein
MNNAEKELLFEVQKRFGSLMTEDVDDYTVMFIEPRVPEDKDNRESETFINVYGLDKATVRGEEPRRDCKLCGGSGKVTIGLALKDRIEELEKDLQFQRQVLALGAGGGDKKATLSKERKSETAEEDIGYVKGILKKHIDDGTADKLVMCPATGKKSCKGWNWADIEIYKDTRPAGSGKYNQRIAKQAPSPWELIVTWIWNILEPFNPQHGARTPLGAGFRDKNDKFGIDVARAARERDALAKKVASPTPAAPVPTPAKSEDEDAETNDIRRHIVISVESLGKTNREVFEKLRKIIDKNKQSLPYFKIDAWPPLGIEDREEIQWSRIENISPQQEINHNKFRRWVDSNRSFYVTGRVEDKRYGEHLGLPKFEISYPIAHADPRDIDDVTDKLTGTPDIKALLGALEIDNVQDIAPWWFTEQGEWTGPVDPRYIKWFVKTHYPEGLPQGMKVGDLLAKAEEEYGSESKLASKMKTTMPPLENKPQEWSDIIGHVKGFSAVKRKERSEKASAKYKESPEYIAKIKGREDIARKAKEEEKYLMRYPGSKYPYWDETIKSYADAVGVDESTAELAVQKYMDSLGRFKVPFNFDRLDSKDAVAALDILDSLDPEDIINLSECIHQFVSSMLCEDKFGYNEVIDHIAASIVADLGSTDAKRAYHSIKMIKNNTTESSSNRDIMKADEFFDLLLCESAPITKILRVVPVSESIDIFNPKSYSCWSAILLNDNSALSGYSPTIKMNMLKIRKTFNERMNSVSPTVIEHLQKMMTSGEDKQVVAESISIIWDAIISGRPVLRDKYDEIIELATKCGAAGLFDANI